VANIGPTELILVLVIALIVLGPKKLPDVGRSVGTGMREFKDAISADSGSPSLTLPSPPDGRESSSSAAASTGEVQ